MKIILRESLPHKEGNAENPTVIHPPPAIYGGTFQSPQWYLPIASSVDYQLKSALATSDETYIDLDDSEDRRFLLVTTELHLERNISFTPLLDEYHLVNYGLKFLITVQG